MASTSTQSGATSPAVAPTFCSENVGVLVPPLCLDPGPLLCAVGAVRPTLLGCAWPGADLAPLTQWSLPCNAAMSPPRLLKLPAIEIALQRNGGYLHSQRRVALAFNLVAGALVFAAAYFLGKASLGLAAMALITTVALGAFVRGVLAWSVRAALYVRILPTMNEHDEGVFSDSLALARRRLLLFLVVVLVLLAGEIVWVTLSPARVLVMLGILVGGAFVLSFVKPISRDVPRINHTHEARATGCRIMLLRSFADGPSRLTRNVLLPVVAAYGELHIVIDATLDAVQSRDLLGEDVPDLQKIATVYRFENDDWKRGVGELIDQTDIAIIEATRLSPGVIWEYARCMKTLPPWRVYPVIDLEGLGQTSLAHHMREFFELVAAEPDMPHDVGSRWFLLAPSADQVETIIMDVHQRMATIVAIESGVSDPSPFGEGAHRRLSEQAARREVAS